MAVVLVEMKVRLCLSVDVLVIETSFGLENQFEDFFAPKEHSSI